MHLSIVDETVFISFNYNIYIYHVSAFIIMVKSALCGE